MVDDDCVVVLFGEEIDDCFVFFLIEIVGGFI